MPLHVRVCLQVWGRNLGLAQAWFFLGHVPSDNLYYFTFRTIFQASGKKADFMSKTESFVRAFGRPERILGVEWWAAISSETFGKLKGGAAIWRHNLVMLAYTAPDKMVVSSNDVKRSFSNKECLMKIQEYEKIRNIGSPSNHGSACACWVSSIAPAQRWFLTRNTKIGRSSLTA